MRKSSSIVGEGEVVDTLSIGITTMIRRRPTGGSDKSSDGSQWDIHQDDDLIFFMRGYGLESSYRHVSAGGREEGE